MSTITVPKKEVTVELAQALYHIMRLPVRGMVTVVDGNGETVRFSDIEFNSIVKAAYAQINKVKR